MLKELQVALYVRVSSEAQVDGYSLEAQEVTLRADAKLRGKMVYKVYRDAGVSGVREDRKGLNELLRDARKGQFGEVLVWTVSRVSRKLSYLLDVVEELKTLNIAFRSLNEEFDITTPMGQFALTMMGAVGQMQRDSWMESARISMENRAKSGKWHGGMMLGYQMVPDEDDPRGGGRLVIVPEEAETVRQIFTMYADGLGYKAIVNRLNADSKTTRNGKRFAINSVRVILGNAAYIGQSRFGNEYYDGTHEPIISREMWEAVQEIMTKRSKPVKKGIDREYYLSGVLKCPVCGSGMIPTHTKNKRKDGSYRVNYYYVCGAYLNKGSAVCKANSVRADDAEEKVLAWLHEFFTSPFWIRRITETIRQRYEIATKPVFDERKQAEQRTTEIVRKQNELLRHYEEDVLDRDSFLKEMQRLKSEKETWQALLVGCEPVEEAPACWSCEEVKVAFRAFRQVLMQAEADQKRQLIRNLVVSIKVNEERRVSGIYLQSILETDKTDSSEIMPLEVAI